MKLKSFSLYPPAHGIKQFAIFGHDAEINSVCPLVYLQRPRWIKDDRVWEKICNSIRLELPKNFEVK